MTLRQRVHRIVSPAEPGDTSSLVFDLAIVGLIVFDLLLFVIDSVDPGGRRLFAQAEYGILTVFTIEYALRMWVCTSDPRYGRRLGRLRYAVTPMALVDLVAILPGLNLLPLGLSLPVELTAVRAFRLLKLIRYVPAVKILGRAFLRVRREFGALFVVMVLVVVSAGILLFRIEGEANPEQFRSIPHAMWWGIVTMTTVGYGDQIPVTATGRLVGSLVMIFGIGMFALPAGLLGAAFTEEMNLELERRRRLRVRRRRRAAELRGEPMGEELTCPHCGERFAHLPDEIKH